MSEKTEQISKDKRDKIELLSCEVCLKEVPASVAFSCEGDDYVFNFCGIECHDKWLHRNDESKNNNEDSN